MFPKIVLENPEEKPLKEVNLCNQIAQKKFKWERYVYKQPCNRLIRDSYIIMEKKEKKKKEPNQPHLPPSPSFLHYGVHLVSRLFKQFLFLIFYLTKKY